MAAPTPHFTVIRSLGGGGMADVALARMRLDGADSWVALKRMRSSLANDPAHRLQFEREGQLGTRLGHPNIVAVRSFGVDADGPYLALEYIEGPTVAALLKGDGGPSQVLPLEVALAVAADVTEGLQYAHAFRERPDSEPGVLHRDVAPDNVLVDRKGIAKLADFGIARAVDATRLTATGSVHGKLRFLAPELFEGAAHTTSTDRYALAGTLFEMLAGVAPFSAPNDAELMKRILSQVPPRLDLLRPDVPAAIAEWIDAALRKRPSERPADLSGLLTELGLCVGDRQQRQRIIAGHLSSGAHGADVLPAPVSNVAPGLTARRAVGLALVGALSLATGAFLLWGEAQPMTSTPAPMVVAPTGPPKVPEALPSPVAPPAATPAAPVEDEPPAAAAQQFAHRTVDGSLWVRVRPWAEVVVDGRSMGQTPLPPLKMSVGKHVVVLINNQLNVHRSYPVRINPGQRTELKVVLSAADQTR